MDMEQPQRHPEQVANHYRKQMCFSLLSEILKEEVRQQVEQYCQRLPSMVMHDYFFATKRKTYGPSTTTEPNCRTSVTNEGMFRIKLDTSNFATNELLVRPLNGQVVITGKHYISKLGCYEFFEMKRSFDIPENVDINTARGYRTPKGVLIIEAALKSESNKAIKIEDHGRRCANKVFKRRKSAELPPRPKATENDAVPVSNGKEPPLFSFMTKEIPFAEGNKEKLCFPSKKQMNSTGMFPPTENNPQTSSNSQHMSSEVAKAAHSFLSVLLNDESDFLTSPKTKESVVSMAQRINAISRRQKGPTSYGNGSIPVVAQQEEYDFPLASNRDDESASDEEYNVVMSQSRDSISEPSASTSTWEPISLPCLKIPHYSIKGSHSSFKKSLPKRSRTPDPISYSLSEREFASTSATNEYVDDFESSSRIPTKKAKTPVLPSCASDEGTSSAENPG